MSIDAHRGERVGGGGGTSKDFEKLDYKNAIKNKNRGPPPKFSHNPSTPLKGNWKWLCTYVDEIAVVVVEEVFVVEEIVFALEEGVVLVEELVVVVDLCRQRSVSSSHISFASNLCFL